MNKIAIIILLTGVSLCSSAQQRVCEQFPLHSVRLLPSRFMDNFKRDSAWMMSMPVSSLLHSFRTNAGVYSGNEGGYLSAYSEGLIDRNIRGQKVWAPWYTLHKIVQGLIDQYQIAGNDTALAIAKRMGVWAYNKTKDNSEDVRKLMIRNEFGGFNEAMYELYAITKDERYLKVANYFYHNDKIDPLKHGNDDLGTNHANTFIPKLLGEARRYELFGDEESRRAAELLFYTLADKHAFVNGEVSDKEHLFAPGTQSKHLTGYDGENCCTYNLLKLADHVFSWNTDSKVIDYYERALYNHILGQQDPESSMLCYFTPLMTGAYRLYSTRDSSFWCCVGSGFESNVKYASSIYFHSDDALWVNLFIPSQVDWNGTVVKQETSFPESGNVRLTVSGRSRHFTLHLRRPYWAASMTVRVNGKRTNKTDITRTWAEGDAVDVDYGMKLTEQALADDASRVALMYGPIVLAGNMGDVAHPFSDPTKYNDYYTYNFNVPQSVTDSATYHSLKDISHVKGLTFETKSGVSIVPFYDAHHCRYTVYWKKK